MPAESSTNIDFFISYTGKDSAWAEWIAWQLEEKGYETLIQAWDFKSGGVFPADMHRALQNSARVIAVLTPAYLESAFCQPEWQAAFADDPTGEKGILVCVKVADFKPGGLLRGRTYIDLFGLSESSANETLLTRLETGRAKPTEAPAFTKVIVDDEEPPFPGDSESSTVEVAPLNTSIPHNLPTLQPFFGREEELTKIADALDPDSRTWGALISGPGGMGKTSLAVRAAYDASPETFHKIVFISLKTRELDDDGVRDLSGFILSGLVELWNELARELDREDVVKAAEDQRPRLLLDAMRGTQTLLLLDNLESLTKPERDSLFTFVKKIPTGCKAVLTSRGRIGSGAEEIILEKFTEKAALETLAELATHNPLLAQTSEAERLVLYRETGGSPLLLRWTAGQLGRGHFRTFSDALRFLSSYPEGNHPLEFVFGGLVDDFSEAETKVLSALTFFTLPTEVKHIHAIAHPKIGFKAPFDGEIQEGPSQTDTETALRSLANRSLAVPTEELKAFTLVPMVAAFLRKKNPEVVAETGDRLEKRAYALIIENGFQKHDCFPTLEAAWPGIAPALPRFLAGDNARLQTVCDALDVFLNFQGRWDEWLILSEKAEVKAVAAGDHSNAGIRTYHAGFVHSLRQQADAVLICADRAATHWETAMAGARERALATRLRGIGHELKKDYPAAITAYREALHLDRSLGDESEDVAVSLNDLANAEQRSGDLDAADGHYREALRVARALNFHQGVATYTGNLAKLALDREDWTTAEALAREALPLSEAIHHISQVASDCQCLAQALTAQGRADEAIPHAQRAIEIFVSLGSPNVSNAQATLAESVASQQWLGFLEGKNSEIPSHKLEGGFPKFELVACRLRNITVFEDSGVIAFGTNGTMLLGDNSTGKSTILKCISLASIGLESANEVLDGAGPAYLRNGASWGGIEAKFQICVSSSSLRNESNCFVIGLSISRDSDRFVPMSDDRITLKTEGAVVNCVEQLSKLRRMRDLPFGLTCAYGPERNFSGDSAAIEPEHPIPENDWVLSLFQKQWLLNPETLMRLMRGDTRNISDAPKALALRLVQDIEEGVKSLLPYAEIAPIGSKGDISIRGENIAINSLSDGYSSVIAFVGHIVRSALRHLRWESNPFLVPGILLIDELDAHLHPTWQTHVLGDLKKVFPNLQIISTTHSPLIAGAVDASDVLFLKAQEGEAHVVPLNAILTETSSMKAWRADQVLTGPGFNLPTSMSREATKWLDDFEFLSSIPREELTSAQMNKLSHLKKILRMELPKSSESPLAREAASLFEEWATTRLYERPQQEIAALMDETKKLLQFEGEDEE